MIMRTQLAEDLRRLLNLDSRENVSNTPDFILAKYMLVCLDAGEQLINDRATWYGRMDAPGSATGPSLAETDPNLITTLQTLFDTYGPAGVRNTVQQMITAKP